MTTSASRGSSTVTSLRLCSRAPVTTMDSRRDIRRPFECMPGVDGLRDQVARVGELRPQVAEERFHRQLLARHPAQELARRIGPPVPMDPVAQPLADRRRVTLADLL